jgi:hypothetical protein
MSAQTNCTTPGTMPSAFNPSSTSSFQDFVFALVFSFAPFLNTLPDWLKLAILGTVLETSRRYVTGWYYSAKDAMFLTIVFDSDDQSFRESFLLSKLLHKLTTFHHRMDHVMDCSSACFQ